MGAFSHLRPSRVDNVHAMLTLDRLGSSTDEQTTQLGDGTVTTQEAQPDLDESALIRRIDIRVVPILSLLFVFAFLDRVNIANAAVYGMNDELGLVGNQYNAALAAL